MSTIIITGGTGLTGKVLTKMLVEQGHQIIILTRNPKQHSNQPNVRFAYWDYTINKIDTDALQEADHIIHLAGAGVVDKPWTIEYRKLIADSRIQTIALLRNSLSKISHKVKSFVSASAIGWYGEDSNPIVPFTENEPADTGFLGATCLAWEHEAATLEQLGIRVCIFRVGIVLARDGGAYAEMAKMPRLGIAAYLGNGKQMVSWIHINDLCRIYQFGVENKQLKGIYNAVAPHPVSNQTLIETIAKVYHPRFHISMPVPSFILKIMLGSRSIEVLKSTTVTAEKIQKAGFQFQYDNIAEAVQEIALKH